MIYLKVGSMTMALNLILLFPSLETTWKRSAFFPTLSSILNSFILLTFCVVKARAYLPMAESASNSTVSPLVHGIIW